MDRKLDRIPLVGLLPATWACASSLCANPCSYTSSQGLQHHKTTVKVKNASYFLKIEKMSWERGRKHILADGLAAGEEVGSQQQAHLSVAEQ